MLIHGCKTGSKLGNFFQKSQIYLTKMGVARACSRSETNNFYQNYYAIQANIFKICGPNSSHIILFGQS